MDYCVSPAGGGRDNGLPRLGAVGGRGTGPKHCFCVISLNLLFKTLLLCRHINIMNPHKPITEPQTPSTHGLSRPLHTHLSHPHPVPLKANPTCHVSCVNLPICMSKREGLMLRSSHKTIIPLKEMSRNSLTSPKIPFSHMYFLMRLGLPLFTIK